MRRIVITGPQPVDMLDLVGPLEVFKFAPEYEVAVASPEGTTELQLNHGFKISYAVFCLKKKNQIDTLVVAGGPGANDELYDDEYLHRIIGLSSRSRRVAAICTGTFVLAAAGLLNGKRAVTHWAYCDKLSRQYPSVVVEPDRIYLRDGSIYTSRYYGWDGLGAGTRRRGSRSPGCSRNRTDIGDVSRSSGRTVPIQPYALAASGNIAAAPRTAGLDDRESA